MIKKAEKPCIRCGSERIITKTWKETIKTFGGTSELTFEQIVCTNKECQERFEKNAAAETLKRNELKAKKEELDLKRKENIALANQRKKNLIK